MKTDVEQCGLRGAVRAVRQETTQCVGPDGELAEKPSGGHSYAFDPEGRLVERVYHNPDGSELRVVNDYSADGRLLATRQYQAADELRQEVRLVYDDAGRLVAEQSVGRVRTATPTVVYAYDGGRKVKIEEFDFTDDPDAADTEIAFEGGVSAPASVVRRVETRYDEADGAVEVKVFGADGALVGRAEITRDAGGRPVEEISYFGDAGPFASDAHLAAQVAALTEEQKAQVAAEFARQFPPGAAVSRTTYRYDAEGRLVESKQSHTGKETGRQTYAYDEAGDVSEEAGYEGEGRLLFRTTFARERDEHGNWTEELVSAAASWDAEPGRLTPRHLTRRVINYW